MKIVMIGTGYVGLVTGTCFAESGNDVTCVDIDEAKIEGLKQGKIPIYEPGLMELVQRNTEAGRLHFTTSYADAVPRAKCVFIAVGTPQSDDGAADLRGVFKVTDTLAEHLTEKTIVVIKSTVPVGTNRKVANRLQELTGRNVDVASNPEFLKEGAAIDDFTKPDRVVVGAERQAVVNVLHDLYKPFLRTDNPFVEMSLESAEMTKYVANCMLATKISFINEMANICERVGADINDVRKGIGHDARIGFSFLFPGVGYGGSCFPKDVQALIYVAEQTGLSPHLLRTVHSVNDHQKTVLFEKIQKHFDGQLDGRVIAIWGLSFKPKTDDIREAPSLVLIDKLLNAGAVLRVHDPVAEQNVQKELKDHPLHDRVTYCKDRYETLENADALAIVTEWNEFRNPDFDYMKQKMKSAVIFDGRNLFHPARMAEEGFYYSGIGLIPVQS
jgi:UDPglucose 6-dehydrogenase